MPASAASADFSSRGFVILRRQRPLVAGSTYQIALAASRGADAIVTIGGNCTELSADDWWLGYKHSYEAAGHPHDQSTTDRIHGAKYTSAYKLTVPASVKGAVEGAPPSPRFPYVQLGASVRLIGFVSWQALTTGRTLAELETGDEPAAVTFTLAEPGSIELKSEIHYSTWSSGGGAPEGSAARTR